MRRGSISCHGQQHELLRKVGCVCRGLHWSSMRMQARQRLELSPRHSRPARHASRPWVASNTAIWLLQFLIITLLFMTAAKSLTVYNPEDLRQAVADGAEDIILANHLDVSSAAAGGYAEFLLDIRPSTRSIRVRFSAVSPIPRSASSQHCGSWQTGRDSREAAVALNRAFSTTVVSF